MKKILILALALTFINVLVVVSQIQNPTEVKTVVVDPVCKMKINPKAKTTINHEHEKVSYSFCSEVCRKSFLKKPEKYIKK